MRWKGVNRGTERDEEIGKKTFPTFDTGFNFALEVEKGKLIL